MLKIIFGCKKSSIILAANILIRQKDAKITSNEKKPLYHFRFPGHWATRANLSPDSKLLKNINISNVAHFKFRLKIKFEH